MDDDGFYTGELNGMRGLLPSNFLQEVNQGHGHGQELQNSQSNGYYGEKLSTEVGFSPVGGDNSQRSGSGGKHRQGYRSAEIPCEKPSRIDGGSSQNQNQQHGYVVNESNSRSRSKVALNGQEASNYELDNTWHHGDGRQDHEKQHNASHKGRDRSSASGYNGSERVDQAAAPKERSSGYDFQQHNRQHDSRSRSLVDSDRSRSNRSRNDGVGDRTSHSNREQSERQYESGRSSRERDHSRDRPNKDNSFNKRQRGDRPSADKILHNVSLTKDFYNEKSHNAVRENDSSRHRSRAVTGTQLLLSASSTRPLDDAASQRSQKSNNERISASGRDGTLASAAKQDLVREEPIKQSSVKGVDAVPIEILMKPASNLVTTAKTEKDAVVAEKSQQTIAAAVPDTSVGSNSSRGKEAISKLSSDSSAQLSAGQNQKESISTSSATTASVTKTSPLPLAASQSIQVQKSSSPAALTFNQKLGSASTSSAATKPAGEQTLLQLAGAKSSPAPSAPSFSNVRIKKR